TRFTAPSTIATPNKACPNLFAPCSCDVNIHIAPPSTNASAAIVLAVGPVKLSTTTCSGWFQGSPAPPFPACAAEAPASKNQQASSTGRTSANRPPPRRPAPSGKPGATAGREAGSTLRSGRGMGLLSLTAER